MIQGKSESLGAWVLRIAFSGKKHQHLLRAKDFFKKNRSEFNWQELASFAGKYVLFI